MALTGSDGPPKDKQSGNDAALKGDVARLFERLETLRKGSWESFDKRRSYEWKVGLAIWTALAVFTGALLTQPADKALPIRGWIPVVVTAVIGALVVGIHIYWSIGIARANQTDKDMSYVPRNKMYALVGISYEREIKPLIKTSSAGSGLTNFSQFTQVGITLLLVIAAVLAMWLRTIQGDRSLDFGAHHPKTGLAGRESLRAPSSCAQPT